MSVYLYSFTGKARGGVQQVHQLKFIRGNAHDPEVARLVNRLCNGLAEKLGGEPFYLPVGTRYVEGSYEKGALVWETTKPIETPIWYDCNPMPGAARIVGHWDGKKVRPHFAVARIPGRLDERGCLWLEREEEPWILTGHGALDHETAQTLADQYNRDAREKQEPVSYEVVPY